MSKATEKTTAPSSLEIHLLGPLRMYVDGTAVDESRWSRRKPKLLVELLALQPHHQFRREQLMEFLWPDIDPEAASNNLHNLYEDWATTRREHLRTLHQSLLTKLSQLHENAGEDD